MSHRMVHRLTDEEHGTVNAALTSFASEVEDISEAEAVRDLAKTLIGGEVLIRPIADPSLADQFTYCVRWSEEDQEHVGTVAEFPSLSWLDADPRAAFDGIHNLVAEVLEGMAQTGEEPPAPGVR